MKKVLMDTVESGKLIALYVNKEDSEKFIVGQVVLVGESDILVVLYDANCLPEALCFCALDTIYRIEQDSLYLNHMQEHKHSEFAFWEFRETPWDSFFQMQGQYDNYVCCCSKNGKSTVGKVMQHSRYAVILSRTKNDVISECVTRLDRSEIAILTVDIANRGE